MLNFLIHILSTNKKQTIIVKLYIHFNIICKKRIGNHFEKKIKKIIVIRVIVYILKKCIAVIVFTFSKTVK